MPLESSNPPVEEFGEPISGTLQRFLRWAWQILRTENDELVERQGEDGIMYTRFIRLCLVLSFVMGILGCTILLPINITASGTSVTEDMGVLTMSNIPKMSDRFIAHIVMTYVYSFLFYGLIIWVFKRYVAVRSAFFSENSARMYTLLVRNIPQKLLHKESLRHWFESHFKVTVLAIQFAWKTKPLDSLLKRRRNLQIKFEKEQIKAQRNRDHPTRSAFEEEIESLNQEISRIQNNKRSFLNKSDSCFVTLSTTLFHRTKIAAFNDPTKMTISPAPDPTDVNWKQVHTGFLSHLMRMIVITSILVTVSLGWTVPQTFIVSLANLSNLRQVSGLSWITNQVITGSQITSWAIVQGFIPAVLISLIQVLVKFTIKTAYTRFGGLPCYSGSERWSLAMYAFFVFFNVFLVVSIEGTFFLVLADIIKEPGQIPSLLAHSLPQQALFFTIWIMVQGMGRLPFRLLRFFSLLWFICKYLLSGPPVPPTKKRELLTAGNFDFVSAYGDGLLVFTIMLCYSIMDPLISVFGFFFFLLVLLVDGYLLSTSTEQKWRGGGKTFSFVMHHLMFSYILFQLLMIGILSLDQFAGGAALLPLPFITAFLWIVLHFGWSHIINYGAIDLVASEEGNLRRETVLQAYLPPSLNPSQSTEPEMKDFRSTPLDGDSDGDGTFPDHGEPDHSISHINLEER